MYLCDLFLFGARSTFVVHLYCPYLGSIVAVRSTDKDKALNVVHKSIFMCGTLVVNVSLPKLIIDNVLLVLITTLLSGT